MNTIPLGPFLGINTRLPDFALHVQDKGDFLRSAVNADINDAGDLLRRREPVLTQAMTGAHSFWTNGVRRYLVRAQALYAVGLSPYSETLLKVLGADDRMSYEEHNGDVYFSNGTDKGRIAADDMVYPWGMDAPAQPTVTTIAGTLPAGKYQVALTYFNTGTGEESGSAGATSHELTSAGALRVDLPGPAPGATHVRVYVAKTNGETPGLYVTATIGTATVDIVDLVTTQTIQTEFLAPLPAGSRLFIHMGRLCSIKGKFAYYSEPYQLGYYNPVQGYIQFEEDISVAIPNQFGVYIAADKTRWFAGSLHAPDAIQDVLPYGAVPGTEFELPHNSKVGWFGSNGIVIADTQGQAEAPMTERLEVTPPASGCSVVLDDGGYRRVVSCGYCMNLSSTAVTTYADYDFTSMSGSYGTKPDGIYRLDGSGPVDAEIGFGRKNFGSEQLKRLPYAYIGGEFEEPMLLEVGTPEQNIYEYEARAANDGLTMQRFDLGRGLRATWFDLTMKNQDGADFKLATASFAPAATERRT